MKPIMLDLMMQLIHSILISINEYVCANIICKFLIHKD